MSSSDRQAGWPWPLALVIIGVGAALLLGSGPLTARSVESTREWLRNPGSATTWITVLSVPVAVVFAAFGVRSIRRGDRLGYAFVALGIGMAVSGLTGWQARGTVAWQRWLVTHPIAIRAPIIAMSVLFAAAGALALWSNLPRRAR